MSQRKILSITLRIQTRAPALEHEDRRAKAKRLVPYANKRPQSAAHGGALPAGCPSWSVRVSEGVTLTNSGVMA
jgi:hypothetical protein